MPAPSAWRWTGSSPRARMRSSSPATSSTPSVPPTRRSSSPSGNSSGCARRCPTRRSSSSRATTIRRARPRPGPSSGSSRSWASDVAVRRGASFGVSRRSTSRVLAVPHHALSDASGPSSGRKERARHHVLVLHGEIEGVLPDRSAAPSEYGGVVVSLRELAVGEWSYVALGHYHVQHEVAPARVVFRRAGVHRHQHLGRAARTRTGTGIGARAGCWWIVDDRHRDPRAGARLAPRSSTSSRSTAMGSAPRRWTS